MVAPIIPYGPTEIYVGPTGKRTYYSSKTGSRQSKPYDVPTAYTRRLATMVRRLPESNSVDAVTAGAWNIWSYFPDESPMVGQAYARFRNSVSDRASVGVSLLELNQSVTMIRERAIQMATFGRHLLRGNLVGAARTLKLSAVPKRASVKKSAANNYLEFHFGWAPLIGDIYSAIDVLQSPIKTMKASGSSNNGTERCDLAAPHEGSNPSAFYPSYTYWKDFKYWAGVRRLKMGADVAVSNPNLWLANQLGLVNPAILVYEKIPFSFVADWFFNVEQFLSSGTDFYGLTLKNAWTTRSFKGTFNQYDKRLYRWWEGSVIVNGGGVFIDSLADVAHLARSTGIAQPSFYVRPFKVFGWRRTAAAVSLLTQQLVRF